MFFNITFKIINIFFCIRRLILALSKKEKVKLVLLSDHEGWLYQRIADEFSTLSREKFN